MRALLLALLLPAVAHAAPKRPFAHGELHTQCLLHAADPKNPWALAHGVTAMGASYAADDGRLAADVIVSDFAKRVPAPDGAYWDFEATSSDGTPVEPHPNLIPKTFVLAGMGDGRAFRARDAKLTLGDLVKSAQKTFVHRPESDLYWREVGWTLDLLSARMSPKAATFRNGQGETVDLDKVMDDALTYLETSQRELAEGLDKGLPEVPKRKQGIYAHACGGLHLVQAVFSWARFPEVKKRWGKRLERQVAILFYRVGSEQRQYEAALSQAPQYKLQLLTQMLKFHGHFLETTGRLRKQLKWKPDDAQKRTVEQAKAYLDYAVRGLKEISAFEQMPELQKSQPQVHLDLIGDSCHAVNGFNLWR